MVHETATQHICLSILNGLDHGDITIRNIVTFSGQPYTKSPTLRLLSTDEIAKISISPGQSHVISFCGAGALGVGVEGMMDLYLDRYDRHFNDDKKQEKEGESQRDNHTRITTLYWNGPWERVGNQFHSASTLGDRFSVTTSLPPEEGVLGNVSVEVRRSGARSS
ncbi:hypothetical protein POX_b02568 [Penicillium oxalicum]|uniref:Uncharacterized protein n=1 Tax=Penicillium oxalicum (strain 114-2 / CGMCC 5302) TaxID=933388 RepID=S8B6W6_PENO1|nr:hypothetical protein POX_b02568 [Penicillium oxalicum]EPS30422.1 hypothetical protein PDE_05373 [Penicillium oxalicum 114-2]KAI2792530.1 hypothetical protein POX_b02568 [Penicillium oxalicum]